MITTTVSAISKTQNAFGESPLGDLIADALRSVMNTDITFMNHPGGIRADMPTGNVTCGDLYTIDSSAITW